MEEITFKTKKIDKIFLLLYFGISLFLLSVAFYTYIQEDDVFVFIPMGLIVLMLLLLSIGSQYFLKIIIKENRLIIKFIFKVYSAEIKNLFFKTLQK